MAGEQLRIYDWGSDLELLVGVPHCTDEPSLLAWSPDCAAILHLQQGMALFVQRETGAFVNQQQLWAPGPRVAAELAWSSSGTAAIFSSSAEVQSGIGLYSVTTGFVLQRMRWLNTGAYVTRLCWSPCGQLLSFVDHGDWLAPDIYTLCVKNDVYVAHGPSGRVELVEELPQNCFRVPDEGLLSPCAPLRLSVDLSWCADTSLIIVGPELRKTEFGGADEIWPVKHLRFGAPSSTLAVLKNLALHRWISHDLVKELVICGGLVAAVELRGVAWGILSVIVLPVGLLVYFLLDARGPFPHAWCLHVPVLWLLLRVMDWSGD